MKWQMELQDSELAKVTTLDGTVHLEFSRAKIITEEAEPQRFPAKIIIQRAKYSKLPKPGRLTDGELYGIMGKPLNGRIPVELDYPKSCELVLSVEDKDYTIEGVGIRLTIDRKNQLN